MSVAGSAPVIALEGDPFSIRIFRIGGSVLIAPAAVLITQFLSE